MRTVLVIRNTWNPKKITFCLRHDLCNSSISGIGMFRHTDVIFPTELFFFFSEVWQILSGKL